MDDFQFNSILYEDIITKYDKLIHTLKLIFTLSTNDTESFSNELIEFILANEYDIMPFLNIIDKASMFNVRFIRGYWLIFKKLLMQYNNKINKLSFNTQLVKLMELDTKINSNTEQEKIDQYQQNMNEIFDVCDKDSLLYIIMNDDISKFIEIVKYQDSKMIIHINVDKPIEIAAKFGSIRIFKFLRANKIRLTANCLIYSIMGKNNEIIQECLREYQPTKYCMVNAIKSHNNDFAIYLFQNFGMEMDYKTIILSRNLELLVFKLCCDNNFGDALISFSSFGIPSLIEDMLEKGVNINHRNENGETALIMATKYCCQKCFDYLANKGADFFINTNNGVTPLMFASIYNCISIARVLIASHVDVNETDNDGFTALMYAAINDNFEIANFLIENGAIVNMKNNNGNTALAWAAQNNSYNVFKLLLENGADLNMKCQDKKTAITLAKDERIKNLIVQYMNNSNNTCYIC